MIDARQLRVFATVARTGSFSAAARELGCTQPAVSQQMKALEKALDTPLAVRSGRGMRPTEAGRALLRHAAPILSGLAAAEEEVAAIAGLRAGRVRLVSFPTACSTLVPAAVAALRSEHAGIAVSLVEAEPPEALAMLRAGECEVALAFRYPGGADGAAGREADGSPSAGSGRQGRAEATLRAAAAAACNDWSELVARPLLDDPLVGLVPVGHPLAARGADRPVGLAELSGEHWIAGCPQCRGHLVEICAGAGFTPRIDFATDDYPAVVGLVAAGLGVAVLPALALGPLRSAGVAVVPVRPLVQREVVALTLPDLAGVPAVRLMLDRLAAVAPGCGRPAA